MNLLGSKASMEAYEYFMRRLKGDERLMNITEKNNVNVDNILYLPVDDGRGHKIVAIVNDLAKHLFDNGHASFLILNVTLVNIQSEVNTVELLVLIYMWIVIYTMM